MNPCHWIFRPALPYAAPFRRHVLGPVVRRLHRPLRHAALWVCTGAATLVPLPNAAPIPPAGTIAPIYGAATPSGYGALPGIVPSLPARGVLLNVSGPVVTSAAVSEATPVPEPGALLLFATSLVGLVLVKVAFT